jgi:hypothetical protein
MPDEPRKGPDIVGVMPPAGYDAARLGRALEDLLVERLVFSAPRLRSGMVVLVRLNLANGKQDARQYHEQSYYRQTNTDPDCLVAMRRTRASHHHPDHEGSDANTGCVLLLVGHESSCQLTKAPMSNVFSKSLAFTSQAFK